MNDFGEALESAAQLIRLGWAFRVSLYMPASDHPPTRIINEIQNHYTDIVATTSLSHGDRLLITLHKRNKPNDR